MDFRNVIVQEAGDILETETDAVSFANTDLTVVTQVSPGPNPPIWDEVFLWIFIKDCYHEHKWQKKLSKYLDREESSRTGFMWRLKGESKVSKIEHLRCICTADTYILKLKHLPVLNLMEKALLYWTYPWPMAYRHCCVTTDYAFLDKSTQAHHIGISASWLKEKYHYSFEGFWRMPTIARASQPGIDYVSPLSIFISDLLGDVFTYLFKLYSSTSYPSWISRQAYFFTFVRSQPQSVHFMSVLHRCFEWNYAMRADLLDISLYSNHVLIPDPYHGKSRRYRWDVCGQQCSTYRCIEAYWQIRPLWASGISQAPQAIWRAWHLSSCSQDKGIPVLME